MAQNELILALDQIEREKGVRKDDILAMVEGAIVSALRKHVGRNANVICAIDRSNAKIRAWVRKKVVETVADVLEDDAAGILAVAYGFEDDHPGTRS